MTDKYESERGKNNELAQKIQEIFNEAESFKK